MLPRRVERIAIVTGRIADSNGSGRVAFNAMGFRDAGRHLPRGAQMITEIRRPVARPTPEFALLVPVRNPAANVGGRNFIQGRCTCLG